MAQEIELKLTATPEKLAKIREISLPGVVSENGWTSVQLNNTYFDTRHLKLREMQIGMRLRAVDGNVIQSVKSAGRIVGGLYQRNESEVQLPRAELDLTKIEEPYLQILIEEAIEEDGELHPVFVTDFTRQKTLLEFADGCSVELALDEGCATRDDRSTPICEIELELKAGVADNLFALAEYLIKEFALVLDSSSKAAKGYGLLRQPTLDSHQFQLVELETSAEAETAFESIAYVALGHWQFFTRQLLANQNPRAVLQLKRALKFVQHMYQVFGLMLSRSGGDELRASWTVLDGRLKPVATTARKIVWLDRLHRQGLDLPENQYQEELAAEFELQIAKFCDFLRSPEYNTLMLRFSRWMFFQGWRSDIKGGDETRLQRSIIGFAGKQLDHALLEIKRCLDPRLELTIADYYQHNPRLLKALDTGLFFGSLFDRKRRTAFRQLWLNLVDDIETLKQLKFYVGVKNQFSEESEREANSEWLKAQQEHLLKKMQEIRTAAFSSKPYWSK